MDTYNAKKVNDTCTDGAYSILVEYDDFKKFKDGTRKAVVLKRVPGLYKELPKTITFLNNNVFFPHNFTAEVTDIQQGHYQLVVSIKVLDILE